MAIKIDRAGAEILASLALDELRGYAARFPDSHAAYLACKQDKIAAQPKRRRSKKTKEDDTIEQS